MMKIKIFFVLVLMISTCYAGDFVHEIENDYKNFYLSSNNLIDLSAGIGFSGIFANTSMDRDIQNYYRENIKGKSTDNLANGFNLIGYFHITVPLLIGMRFLFKDTSADDWAQMSLRAIIVGTPSVLFTQRITGASRPDEGDSKWRPFKSNNGVSGHAFIGAVPFITAAKMNENAYIKGVLYGASFLPALARINNNKHYFSQVMLGWYLGLLSVNTVEKVNSKNKTVLILSPLPNGGISVFINQSF